MSEKKPSSKKRTPLTWAVTLWLLTCAVLVSPANAFELFIHEATPSNSFLHVTQMDHPAINGDPDAFMIVTHVANPKGDLNSVENPAEIAVSYSPGSGRWSIENQDISAMTPGARFFVMVPEFSGTIEHENTAGNTSGAVTTIDATPANGRDDGRWLATRVRTRTGSSGGFNDHPVALAYDFLAERWTVINQDGGTMPATGGFNVEGFATASGALTKVTAPSARSTTHVTDLSNTSGNLTRIDRDLLSGSPYSFVFATLEASGTLNPHPIGVAYDFFAGQWAIFNADGAAMPTGAVFTVEYVPVLFFDGFESGDFSGGWTLSVP